MNNPRIRVFFEHKLTTADFDQRVMVFHNSAANEDLRVSFDLCIGADGSYSNVRRQLMRFVRYINAFPLKSLREQALMHIGPFTSGPLTGWTSNKPTFHTSILNSGWHQE